VNRADQADQAGHAVAVMRHHRGAIVSARAMNALLLGQRRVYSRKFAARVSAWPLALAVRSAGPQVSGS
jgi:hypothetical protein